MMGKYQVVKEISLGEIIARVTARPNDHGYRNYSYRIVRFYQDQDGQPRETSWFSSHHLPLLKAILPMVEEFIDGEKRRDRQRVATVHS